MTMTIATLPNTITEGDEAFLRHLLYGRNQTNTLYENDGDCYVQDPLSVALFDEHGDLFIDKRKAYTYCDDNRTFTNNVTGVVYSLSNYICISDSYSDEIYSLSLDLIGLVPRGMLFEQYKSELVIAPYVVDGKYNFADDGVANILDNLLGINPDGSNSDIAAWEGYYLIYHPLNHTHVSYVPEAQGNKYNVTYLNNDFECDSLDVALMITFDWAVSECDYELNNAPST